MDWRYHLLKLIQNVFWMCVGTNVIYALYSVTLNKLYRHHHEGSCKMRGIDLNGPVTTFSFWNHWITTRSLIVTVCKILNYFPFFSFSLLIVLKWLCENDCVYFLFKQLNIFRRFSLYYITVFTKRKWSLWRKISLNIFGPKYEQ